MYRIFFKSEFDGTIQAYRISAISELEAISMFCKQFPNIEASSIRAVKEAGGEE